MTYVHCPQCDLPAEITDRFTLAGAGGALTHVKTVCVAGHWFTPREEDVETLLDGGVEVGDRVHEDLELLRGPAFEHAVAEGLVR
jgi:hypothetical protein